MKHLDRVIQKGYTSECDYISELIDKRIFTRGDHILSEYINEERDFVNLYCDKKDIDLALILNSSVELKADLGIKLIDADIKERLTIKQATETEIKELGIKTIKFAEFTNGIELCPWLTLMGSPTDLKWWTRRTNSLIDKLDPNNKYYDWTITTINNIRDNWVAPELTRPDIEDFHLLYNLELPDEVRDYIVFHSGK